MKSFITGTNQHILVHEKHECAGEYCCIHNPSKHHMINWPLHWRYDRQIFERLDPEGVGHPDPDDVEYHKRKGVDISIHGCNGLCNEKNYKKFLDSCWSEE